MVSGRLASEKPEEREKLRLSRLRVLLRAFVRRSFGCFHRQEMPYDLSAYPMLPYSVVVISVAVLPKCERCTELRGRQICLTTSLWGYPLELRS